MLVSDLWVCVSSPNQLISVITGEVTLALHKEPAVQISTISCLQYHRLTYVQNQFLQLSKS